MSRRRNDHGPDWVDCDFCGKQGINGYARGDKHDLCAECNQLISNPYKRGRLDIEFSRSIKALEKTVLDQSIAIQQLQALVEEIRTCPGTTLPVTTADWSKK